MASKVPPISVENIFQEILDSRVYHKTGYHGKTSLAILRLLLDTIVSHHRCRLEKSKVAYHTNIILYFFEIQ